MQPGNPSALAPQKRDWDLLLTAETHNFPCAVAPFPGGWCARRKLGVQALRVACPGSAWECVCTLAPAGGWVGG